RAARRSPPRNAQAVPCHVGLPPGDVVRRRDGRVRARLRLQGVRAEALRPPREGAPGPALRGLDRGGPRIVAALRELPGAARCVIVGGGVGGTSIAYHLVELGWDDVVVLERNQLTSGSTFHSAGLVGQLRSSVNLTRMMMYSVELYRKLGDACGWGECGGIRVAAGGRRMEELRRQAGWAKTFGLPLELISAEEARELFPLMSTDGVLGAAWLPTDGYIDPAQLTYALAEGAREGGVDIFTNTRVTGIEAGRVRTERGDIDAEVGVIAGGMFSAELGRLAGVRIPVVPM